MFKPQTRALALHEKSSLLEHPRLIWKNLARSNGKTTTTTQQHPNSLKRMPTASLSRPRHSLSLLHNSTTTAWK
jgi:hypothetical protein